jgi:hypothetical protein
MDLEYLSGEALPKRTFVECFRVVCWQFVVYQKQLGDIPPFYDDCPKICYRLGKDKVDKDYCEGCDIKDARDAFEQEAKAELDERVGEKWKIYSFESLLGWVYDAFELKQSKKKDMSITADIMVGILISEQNKQRRIDDYNREQERKQK